MSGAGITLVELTDTDVMTAINLAVEQVFWCTVMTIVNSAGDSGMVSQLGDLTSVVALSL